MTKKKDLGVNEEIKTNSEVSTVSTFVSTFVKDGESFYEVKHSDGSSKIYSF